MKLYEKTLEKKEIFNGKVIHVTEEIAELEDGSKALREVVGHPGGVCIAALTENDELLFVRQFRYPYKEVLLELPAGKLEKGQTPLENGKRELLEEIIHLYFCKVERFERQQLDEDEFLSCEKIPLKKAVEMVLNNEIVDAKTQTAVLKTAMLYKKLTGKDGDMI